MSRYVTDAEMAGRILEFLKENGPDFPRGICAKIFLNYKRIDGVLKLMEAKGTAQCVPCGTRRGHPVYAWGATGDPRIEARRMVSKRFDGIATLTAMQAAARAYQQVAQARGQGATA